MLWQEAQLLKFLNKTHVDYYHGVYNEDSNAFRSSTSTEVKMTLSVNNDAAVVYTSWFYRLLCGCCCVVLCVILIHLCSHSVPISFDKNNDNFIIKISQRKLLVVLQNKFYHGWWVGVEFFMCMHIPSIVLQHMHTYSNI